VYLLVFIFPLSVQFVPSYSKVSALKAVPLYVVNPPATQPAVKIPPAPEYFKVTGVLLTSVQTEPLYSSTEAIKLVALS
jgi:hypothetical protein